MLFFNIIWVFEIHTCDIKQIIVLRTKEPPAESLDAAAERRGSHVLSSSLLPPQRHPRSVCLSLVNQQVSPQSAATAAEAALPSHATMLPDQLGRTRAVTHIYFHCRRPQTIWLNTHTHTLPFVHCFWWIRSHDAASRQGVTQTFRGEKVHL